MLVRVIMDERIQNLNRYLDKVLGVKVRPKEWQNRARLSFHLQDLYSFWTVSILNAQCLLMLPNDKKEQSPAVIGKHIEQLRAKWDGEVIYVHDAVSAYNRTRLIEQRTNFVVPGTQMYLPWLALDLRERFNQARQDAPEKFTKATQLVVLYALKNGLRPNYTPSRLAKQLGYTLMTMTRAFSEIESLGLAEVAKQGRERLLAFQYGPKSLWEKALVYMKSPVRRRVWAHPPAKHWPGLTAGLSALAEYTNIAPPSNPISAVSIPEWNAMRKFDVTELATREPGACSVEIWSYSPHILAGENAIAVDRFSLYLSMKDDTDERVLSALEEMMEGIQW